ncbi:MAG: methylmalonyl-CoA mutase family protein [Acidobacteriota bacterium]|nr:methylmalonyl-CoA mutase family protein [Acidobacteriota bacterium]NLH11794.1 methylmalonyl-CoA mutase [Holophagae bacterium]
MDMPQDRSSTKAPPERLLAEFPVPSLEQWYQEVVRLLKGAPFEKKMLTPTVEGITLKPLYTADDLAGLEFPTVMPGDSPFPRGTRLLGFREGAWLVAQELPYPTYDELNAALRFDLDRGQTAVNLLLDRATQAGLDPDMAKVGEVGAGGTSIASLIGLARALDGVDLEQVPILVQPGSAALPFAALLVAYLRRHRKDVTKLRGSLGMDPLCGLVSLGKLPVSLGRAYDELTLLTRWAAVHAPAVATLAAYGFPYHDSGASAVQELAFTLATAVEHLRQLDRRGVDVETAARRTLFGLSVGSHFFMEVAKLRAARMLWARVVRASGGSEAASRMTLHVRSSSWNKTAYDPCTNILRATTEAFAAVLGGCDSLHVAAFDEALGLPSELGRRIARNTQTILRDEVHLDALVDPAGGSWAIETLTAQVAEKAWALFQQLESAGGMLAAIEKGLPQRMVGEVAEEREKAFASRRESLLGVNVYPNPTEARPVRRQPDYAALHAARSARLQALRCSQEHGENVRVLASLQHILDSRSDELFESLVSAAERGATIGEFAKTLRTGDAPGPDVTAVRIHRAAEPFEALRAKVEQWRESQAGGPQVFVAAVGSLAELMPRIDFTRGFFEVGGLAVDASATFATAEEAQAAAVGSGAPIVVVLSTDERYPVLVPALAAALKAARPEVLLVLAGYPKEHIDAFKPVGIDEFIHLRSDVHATLVALATRIGVRS